MNANNPDFPKITCAEDCGNSPKKQQLKEFNIAVVTNDTGFVYKNTSDNILWDFVGLKTLQGKENLNKAMHQSGNVLELIMKNIITHGRTGAVNGTLITENHRYEFCNVYNFKGTVKNSKIKEITTYLIEK
ncbi:hypothetical protein [Virgibacillus doumboii]|uniref:hypothetical protein n=1 Tax=Virgibacillus doumboii TaxID=2697503 RepID=UPI0013E0BD5E|nr:hypothetical protein [Virgibacillus doumboii]